MHRVIALTLGFVSLLQAGCFVVGAAYLGHTKQILSPAELQFDAHRGKAFKDGSSKIRTPGELIALWDTPESEGTTPSGCTVLRYHSPKWNVVGLFLGVGFPIPLGLPTGHGETLVYVRDDTIEVVSTDVEAGGGAMLGCGINMGSPSRGWWLCSSD